jgi:hypothetical protein
VKTPKREKRNVAANREVKPMVPGEIGEIFIGIVYPTILFLYIYVFFVLYIED